MKVDLLPKYYNPDLTFIQTDKSVYKPGQLVQFRVLTVDTELKPSEDQISSLFIETPGKVRVEQWNNVQMEDGLLLFEFQLSEEPELGTYTIKADRNGKEEKATFKVEEYVLPKYEVTLTPPKYITFQSRKAEAKVCARYTFGKPVLGTVEGSVCLKRQQSWRASSDVNQCIQVRGDLEDGCYTIDVSDSDVGWNRFTSFQYGMQLEISAEVREQGSGVRLDSKSASLRFQRYDYSLKLEGPDKYKPGLSYRGLIVAKKLDGTPKSGLEVSIEISSWASHYQSYSKTYTTDSNGLVKFGLPAIAGDVPSMSLRARPTRDVAPGYGRPSAWKSVKGWYSPSGSFLQIEPKSETLACPSNPTFKIYYTTSVTQSTDLHYQVVGIGDIALTDSKRISIRKSTKIDDPDDETWDVTPKPPCYYYWWRCHVPLARAKRQLNGNSIGRVGPVGSFPHPIPQPSPTPSPMATHKGKFEISVRITPETSTKGKLLVYYVRADNEVVADSIEFNVQPCTSNDVDMTFNKAEARPGERISLSLTASPRSLCNYGIVDKSVFLQGGDNQLTLAGTIQKIQQFALTRYSGVYESASERCKAANTASSSNVYYRVNYDDAAAGFKSAGLATMTDLDIHTSPCVQQQIFARRFSVSSNSFDGMPGAPGPSPTSFAGANGNTAGSAGAAGAPGPDGAANRNSGGDEAGPTSGSSTEVEAEITQTLRTYFPETWLFGLTTTNGRGAKILRETVPDTITEWVGNAVCINPTAGLGVSAPASLVAFQPFFVSMNLPYSLIRTEKAPIAVTVFNYQSSCMAVRLSMNALAGYTVQGSSSEVKCVCSQDSVTSTFTIIMNDIGDIDVSITGEVVNMPSACPRGSRMSSLTGTSDTVIRPVVVEPEGTPREYTVSDFLCMTDPQRRSNSGRVSAEHALPLPDSDVLVGGSERAFVKVVGDVMGPALSNVGKLLRMPYGCTEQTMVSFAPNIFVMQYLEAVNRESSTLKEKAIQYMKQGYQRILKSAHNDQSYSSFAVSSPQSSGSMWLTAFVVKCLGLADEYVYIDPKIQAKSIAFFKAKQERNGCFPRLGMVHNKYMQGGFGNNRDNKAALTAFVSIAMIEAGVNKQDKSLVDAFSCIDSQSYTDSYTTALVAYAYSLFSPTSSAATRVYTKLQGQVITENSQKYWKANQDEPERPEIHWWWYRPRSADTETTAYALLTIVNMESGRSDKISEGLAITKWLSTQRNPWGGFGSTQDTVIGLQALAAYAELIYDGGISAAITVSEKSGSTNVASFNLNSGNSLVEFTTKIPRVTDLKIEASGKGCFLIQTNVRYNVKTADTERQAFVTSVEIFNRAGGDRCTAKSMKICTKYVGEGGVSNMAIVEAKMVSGWIPDKDSLESLKSDSTVDLQKYEINANGAAQLYFNELSGTRKCFTFDINRKYHIRDVKPSGVITYDYYKTELRQEVEYEIDNC